MSMLPIAEISTQINIALQGPLIAAEIKEIESERFCMDDLLLERSREPLVMLAKELMKLRGKKIESIDWVSTFEPTHLAHVGFFRIKVS